MIKCKTKLAAIIISVLFVAASAVAISALLFSFRREARIACAEEQTFPVAAVSIENIRTEYVTVEEAFSAANSAVTDSDSRAEIKLLSDVSVSASLDVESGKFITLDLNGFTVTYSGSTDGVGDSVISVCGSLKIEDNAAVKQEKPIGENSVFGGLITSDGAQAVKYGGGVYVTDGGTLDLSGGNISGNTARGFGGGVYISSGGTFNMYGGEISFNSADIGGGGVAADGVFNMFGGKIRSNCVVKKDAVLNGGGGIVVGTGAQCGEATVSGNAEVSDNSSVDSGGGVFVNIRSSCTVGGNAIVSRNTSKGSGGGIYLNSGSTCTVGDNAQITDNTASIGGGICSSEGSADKPVYLHLYGGSVTENRAVSVYDIGGICFRGSTIYVKGAPVVSNNYGGEDRENLYVRAINGIKSLKVVGELKNKNAYARIYVFHEGGIITSDYSEFNDFAPGKVFACDSDAYCLRLEEGEAALIKNGHTWKYVSDGDSHWQVCVSDGCEVASAPTNHVYDLEIVCDETLKSEATGISPAVYYKSCVCGLRGTETFTYGGLGSHTEDFGTVTKEPTCIEPGLKAFKCVSCGTVIRTETIDALGHSWGEWSVTKQPTCTEAGEQTCVCGRDGTHAQSEELPPLGHSWGEWSVTKQPTCTEAGEQTRVCDRDGAHTESDDIPMIPHSFGEFTEEVAATYETEGIKGHKDCAVCGKHFDRNGNEIESLVIPKKEYIEVTVQIDGGIIIGADGSSINVRINSNVTVVAEFVEGKTFLGWSEDGGKTTVSADAVYTFSANRDIHLTSVYNDNNGLSDSAVVGMVLCAVMLFMICVYVIGLILYRNRIINWKVCDVLYSYVKRKDEYTLE